MAKTRIEHTVIINRPVEEVFAFMEQAANMPKWAEKVVEAEQTSPGPVGLDTTCRVVNQAMGQTFEQTFVVTEYERNRIYAAKTTSGPIDMSMKYTIEPMDGGTKLHVVTEGEMTGIMSMVGPVIKRMAENQIKTDHDNLKRLLESGRQDV
jgi:uncharacterized membrane protein